MRILWKAFYFCFTSRKFSFPFFFIYVFRFWISLMGLRKNKQHKLAISSQMLFGGFFDESVIVSSLHNFSYILIKWLRSSQSFCDRGDVHKQRYGDFCLNSAQIRPKKTKPMTNSNILRNNILRKEHFAKRTFSYHLCLW